MVGGTERSSGFESELEIDGKSVEETDLRVGWYVKHIIDSLVTQIDWQRMAILRSNHFVPADLPPNYVPWTEQKQSIRARQSVCGTRICETYWHAHMSHSILLLEWVSNAKQDERCHTIIKIRSSVCKRFHRQKVVWIIFFYGFMEDEKWCGFACDSSQYAVLEDPLDRLPRFPASFLRRYDVSLAKNPPFRQWVPHHYLLLLCELFYIQPDVFLNNDNNNFLLQVRTLCNKTSVYG